MICCHGRLLENPEQSVHGDDAVRLLTVGSNASDGQELNSICVKTTSTCCTCLLNVRRSSMLGEGPNSTMSEVQGEQHLHGCLTATLWFLRDRDSQLDTIQIQTKTLEVCLRLLLRPLTKNACCAVLCAIIDSSLLNQTANTLLFQPFMHDLNMPNSKPKLRL